MLDSIYHMTSNFCWKTIKILPSFTQHYNGRHYVTLINPLTTSGLSISLESDFLFFFFSSSFFDSLRPINNLSVI